MKRFWAILIAGVLLAWVPAATLANGDEHHEEELAEPLFTNKAFLENEITIEVEFENKETVDETALAFTGSWIILPRLQVGMEIPIGIRAPEVGESTHDLSDIEFSGKFLIPHPLEERLILSTGFDLAVPSGDGDKQIGGKGEWALSVNAGTAIPLSNLGGEFAGAPDLGVHFEFGYAQQIQLTDPQVAEAKELGVEDVLEKEVIWRLAFNSQLFGGILTPVLEFLGRTVVDAIESKEEGTIYEVGGGFWLKPFNFLAWQSGDKSLLALEPLSIGVAAKGPVTNLKESETSALIVLKWEFPG